MRILVIEDEEDLRELIGFILESQFLADISFAASGNQAIRLLEASPDFDCIVSDYSMPDGTGEDVFRWLISHGKTTPFVLVSAFSAENYPIFKEHKIAGFIAKPDIFNPLKALIGSLHLKPSSSRQGPGYFGIHTRVILKHGLLAQDLYIKLSDGKYVKAFRKGDFFDTHDFERFEAKTIEHLYVKAQDAGQFLASIQENISRILCAEKLSSDEAPEMVTAATEIINKVNERLGFTAEAQALAASSAKLALRYIIASIESNRSHPLNIALPDMNSYLGSHSMAQAHISCGIASLLGWTSETTFLKLSLAALLHDITLVNPELARVRSLVVFARERARFSEDEAQSLLSRPENSARLVKEMKDVPPDIDLILEQQDEKPDGSGPLRLDHSSINPLAAVFIVAHDIIDLYVDNGTNADLTQFVNCLNETYGHGRFKPILRAITSSLVLTSGEKSA